MSTEPKNSTWVTYPTPGSGNQFLGLQTNSDPSAVPDLAMVNGQNTFVNNGDRISLRPFGLSLFPSNGTLAVSGGGVKSAWTFRLRTGENIMLRAYSTVLEWFDQTSNAWALLQGSQSSDDFGFAEFNINANQESRIYFGNGVNDFAYWTGIHTNLNGALVGGEATIPVTSTTNFSATGSIVIGTTTVTYTGVTGTSFTGAVGTPAAATGLAVAQAVITDGSAPKGNIYMTAQNRLFISGLPANPQLILFCAYGDPTTWSTNTVLSSTATGAGAFNLIEGGGQVTAMTQDELSLYFFKDACIYSAVLSDSLYALQMLKPFEGRSRASGALGKRGVFNGGNFVFVVTPDNQIKAVQRVTGIDYPQLKPISFPIQPTMNDLDFTDVSGIAFRDYAYFACKSSTNVQSNDTVLPFNLVVGQWEAPILGWQVGEFVIYNDGNGDDLYFGDANAPNTWLVTTAYITDGPYIVTASYSTKQYDFGSPTTQKELDDVFIEGYISPSTTLQIRLLLDDGGVTGLNQTNFLGSEATFIFNYPQANSFGLSPFGVARFGSSQDLSGKKKFRVNLMKNLRRVPFYNCQLQFISSGENQQWEVLRYGFLVRPHSQPIRSSLMRNFS